MFSIFISYVISCSVCLIPDNDRINFDLHVISDQQGSVLTWTPTCGLKTNNISAAAYELKCEEEPYCMQLYKHPSRSGDEQSLKYRRRKRWRALGHDFTQWLVITDEVWTWIKCHGKYETLSLVFSLYDKTTTSLHLFTMHWYAKSFGLLGKLINFVNFTSKSSAISYMLF